LPDERRSSLVGSSDLHAQTSVLTEERGQHFVADDLLVHCSHPEWHPEPNSNVFSNAERNPQGAEQFRTLRSRLYQIRGNQTLRTLLVTSAAPAEGKTFVTGNLAQAISRQADRRTLIIDADLRCSRLHSALGAPNMPGLSDYLRGEVDERSVIQHGQTGNLWLIPGGTNVTNPSELLSNGRMKTLLDRMAPIFDWVIIDSPPCLPVADASVMADFCDGVLLVVRAGSTPSDLVRKAGNELRKGKVVGVILNAVESEAMGYGSYYSYGNYGQAPAK
jgi:capsular exopolysaccharide synthesis family protein